MSVFVTLGVISLLIWLSIALHPARPWDFQPVGDDGEAPPTPPQWPSVTILVPARNEYEALPHTLPGLLLQDYPGSFSVVVIDDRSQDGTADLAKKIAADVRAAARLTVISGAPLPQGWVGKVWALEQGAAYCGIPSPDFLSDTDVYSSQGGGQSEPPPSGLQPQYFLLTDADIRHASGSLRRLVAESERGHFVLNSRMARLRCLSTAERLLIPPFVFFFNLLYPMRQVNNPQSVVAAAAGGCVLLATAALRQAGGFACIKDRIIDDVSLAKAVKKKDMPIQLTLSRREVESLRVYESVEKIWVMVRRTAFTELRYSWLRLVGTGLGMTLMFLLPPVLTVWGVLWGLVWIVEVSPMASLSELMIIASGMGAWLIAALVYRPAIRFFGLPVARIWMLPLAGLLYGAMTLDSALRYAAGRRIGWRDH